MGGAAGPHLDCGYIGGGLWRDEFVGCSHRGPRRDSGGLRDAVSPFDEARGRHRGARCLRDVVNGHVVYPRVASLCECGVWAERRDAGLQRLRGSQTLTTRPRHPGGRSYRRRVPRDHEKSATREPRGSRLAGIDSCCLRLLLSAADGRWGLLSPLRKLDDRYRAPATMHSMRSAPRVGREILPPVWQRSIGETLLTTGRSRGDSATPKPRPLVEAGPRCPPSRGQ